MKSEASDSGPTDLAGAAGEYGSASGIAYLDGVPAPAVQLLIRGEHRRYGVTTDADGYYFAEQLHAGTNTLTYAPNHDRGPYRAVEDVVFTIQPGQYLQHQNIELTRNPPLEFQFRDSSGAPISEVRVEGRLMRGGYFNVTSNAEGVATILVAEPGADFEEVNISHIRYRSPERHITYRYEDAPHEIVLERKDVLGITLMVTRGGRPSEHLMYQLNGKEVGRQLSRGTFFPLGRLELPNLDTGHYQVDVLETDDAGARSGYIAHLELDLKPEDDGKEVHVPLGRGGTIRGKVMTDPNTMVADAEITLSPPSTWNQPNGINPFDQHAVAIRSVRTRANGTFAFENLPWGRYSLAAEHPTYGTATVFTTPDGKEATLSLTTGTALYGKATARDGSPIVGARISLGSSGSDAPHETTDAEGNYRIANVPDGATVFLHAPHLQMEDSRDFFVHYDLRGKEIRVDFDYSNRVRLTGRLIVENPGSATFNTQHLSFRSANPRDKYKTEPGPDNTYSVLLDPGEYSVNCLQLTARGDAVVSQFTIDHFTLNPTPKEQMRDFHISLTAAEVVVVFPSDQDITPGRISLAQEGTINYIEAYIESTPPAYARIPSVISGSYTIAFNSHDRLWEGKVDAEIQAGVDNMIILDARRPVRGRRIADWVANRTYQPIDITEHVKPGSDLVLTVVLEKDRGTYTIFYVAILHGSEGTPLVDSYQRGITGRVDQNNTYRFSIPADADEGPYFLRLGGSMNGDPDAAGGIYME